MRLGVVICDNGRGHHVRVERVLSCLRSALPSLSVETHVERGVRWSRDAATYDDGRLLDWHERARGLSLLDADVVLSDNLVAVLAVRPDAILMGSFLWSDVLRRAHPSSTSVGAFADVEDALLKAHRPSMVCLEAFAMPAVRALTNAHEVGVMVERSEASAADVKDGRRVVFCRGKTGAADAVLDDAKSLVEGAGFTCLLRDDVQSLQGALAVVGRPGIGTVTDCVAARVPVVALAEPGNPEMQHNGARIEELGLGLNIEGANEAADAVRIVRERRPRMHANLRTIRQDGVAEAARFIEARMMA